MNTRLLYLDIDGVLLGKSKPDDTEIILANHAKEFLEFCLKHYKCYWLTTHCKEGDVSSVINMLKGYSDTSVIKLIKSVNPTSWKTFKTEAIDFSSDFYWVDNQPLWSETELLKKNNVLDRLILADTRKEPDALKRVMSILADRGSK